MCILMLGCQDSATMEDIFWLNWHRLFSYQVHVEEELPHATAVPSRLSTKDVVITVVQEETTIDHGVLRHPIMIETDSGAIAEVRN